MSPSHRAFLVVSALLFAASTTVTIVWCASMSSMGEMPMPGGWTMSMAWMRMPGRHGPAPRVVHRHVVRDDGGDDAAVGGSDVVALPPSRASSGQTRLGGLTALVGAGYFFVWTALGVATFPIGVALAELEMRQPALSRAVPIAIGLVVLIAGALQLTRWKSHHLACCRSITEKYPAPDAAAAWRHGLRLGMHCVQCCAGRWPSSWSSG
jgi:predicted metal-binding membrane protein